jgi:DNA-binding PadR family transcriptional regulator
MPSPQTTKVLAALAGRPEAWRHGYDLAVEVDLKSGSLYPILMRLAERELLEAVWEEHPPPGRPARHLYRLTGEGLALAAAVQDSMGPAAVQPAGTRTVGTRTVGARTASARTVGTRTVGARTAGAQPRFDTGSAS